MDLTFLIRVPIAVRMDMQARTGVTLRMGGSLMMIAQKEVKEVPLDSVPVIVLDGWGND